VQFCDVNALVYAHRRDSPAHGACREWLESLVDGGESQGVSDLVLGGSVRVVTYPKAFARPGRLEDALAFAARLRDQEHCVPITPGPRHRDLFQRLRNPLG
jgi:predicted nucleic acid-binding protein